MCDKKKTFTKYIDFEKEIRKMTCKILKQKCLGIFYKIFHIFPAEDEV